MKRTAYCGPACRDRRRYRVHVGYVPLGARRRPVPYLEPEDRAQLLRSVRLMRSDRAALARVGACIGCGENLPQDVRS